MRVFRAVILLVCGLPMTAKATDAERPRINADTPVVIAFFEPVNDQQLENDPDTNDALDDFQHYARATRVALDGTCVNFHEIYAREFAVAVDGVETVFTPAVTVGYYFVAPGREARVEYGVHTDDDILALVEEVFGVKAPQQE